MGCQHCDEKDAVIKCCVVDGCLVCNSCWWRAKDDPSTCPAYNDLLGTTTEIQKP